MNSQRILFSLAKFHKAHGSINNEGSILPRYFPSTHSKSNFRRFCFKIKLLRKTFTLLSDLKKLFHLAGMKNRCRKNLGQTRKFPPIFRVSYKKASAQSKQEKNVHVRVVRASRGKERKKDFKSFPEQPRGRACFE